MSYYYPSPKYTDLQPQFRASYYLFLTVDAKKRKNYEQNFVLKQVNTAYRQQMITGKLFHEHFNQI